MKWASVVFLLLSIVLAVFGDELPLAEICDKEACQLPDCRCSSTDIPGGIAPRDTPQFVLLTFDDGVNIINIETYRSLYGRQNSNSCPIGITYYVNHEYTNYQLVNELYNQGFEIALHSITHQTPQQYWAQATYEIMKREIGDQKGQMAHFANIPEDEIKGVRIPFLQLTGNSSFQVMSEVGLAYDCTWPTLNLLNPGLWPYTLDYASIQECPTPPCPTASIPGTWVLPMVSWLDLNGVACAMVDSCYAVPPLDDEKAWYDFIVQNFERQYLGNRAPFGFYIHEWYLSANPAVKKALDKFLDLVTSLNDAFVVNSNEVIEWTKNPVPLNEYRQRSCRSFTRTNCPLFNCGPLRAAHNGIDYWMQACASCPRVYPWLGNPYGQ